MTQNDIAYYSARKAVKDARLKRKETKRHNLATEAESQRHNVASEGADYIAAQARMLGSQASQVSAEAAKQNAATNRDKYNLDYATEYGYQPGYSPNSGQGWDLYDLETGTVYHANVGQGFNVPEEYGNDVKIVIPSGQMPASYLNTIGKAGQARVEAKKTSGPDTQKTIWDTIFTAGKTVNVVIDTGGHVVGLLDDLKQD